jgi:hypothetical protein
MKRIISNLVLTMILIMVSHTIILAQTPTKAIWFMQKGSSYDSTSQVFIIELQWKNGTVDTEHPKAEYYNIYRSMIGHNENPENFDLVGTITDEESEDGLYKYYDEVKIHAGYFYYVVGYSNDEPGEMTPIIQAFSFGSYCVNTNGEIVDFKSFPVTIAVPGERYEYEAYAKHRSLRVQGWVRYHLEEGPEGMTVDNLSGMVEWDVPSDAEGQYYVKIKATSDEDDRAESIQEWYIRIANEDEIDDYYASSVYEISDKPTLIVYPNPAADHLRFNYQANNYSVTIELIDMAGNSVYSTISDVNPGDNMIDFEIMGVSSGSYMLRITDGNKISFGKVIIK